MKRFNYKLLLGKIIETFGSRKAFAKEMGWSEAKLSGRLNCHRFFDQDEIDRIAELLSLKDKDIPRYFFTK